MTRQNGNKIYAVGDIHGCHDKLVALMDQIDIDWQRDTLVFIGDYIDRGVASYDVVEYLIHLHQKHPEIVFLKGNHEEMLENYLAGCNRMNYLSNGGRETLDEYLARRRHSDDHPIPGNHQAFFSNLRTHFETDDYIFVHAGLRDRIPLEKQAPEDLLWIRSQFLHSTYDFGKVVVFGHTPFSKPFIQPNKIGIDTGAVYGRALSCVKLPDMTFFQV
jgi:serine/threonine protein phosphatase 1